MSGYRCVNYYELCRLCTASHGVKTHIFSEEGRKKDLIGKISVCLPVVIDEQDKLPKILCAQCLVHVEAIAKFRETCINAQNMLESCLNSSKLRNGGKVYIKDVAPKKTVTTTSTATTTVPTISSTTTTKPTQQKTSSVQNPSDFLSSIIQAVGIQNSDDSPSETQPSVQQQPTAQYTITLDGQTIKANQIHYNIEPTKPISVQDTQNAQTYTHTYQNSTITQVDEFLKLKPPKTNTVKKKEPANKLETSAPKKQKINLVIATPTQQKPPALMTNRSQATTSNKAISLQDLKFISPNKCYLPITLKDGTNDQQIVAQIDTKNIVLPTAYLQMKLQPQITTVDGQHVVQLTSANLPSSLSIAPTQSQTVQAQIRQQQAISTSTNILPTATSETKTIFTTSTGQNVTITHQPIATLTNSVQQQQLQQQPQNKSTQSSSAETSKVQLTTLQNVTPTNVTLPLPQKSGITIQRIKSEPVQQSLQTTKSEMYPVSLINVACTINSTTTATTTTTVSSATSATKTNASSVKNEIPTCDVCEKVFKRKEHLAQHIKLHLGLRPFKCEEPNCNKAFSRKEHLMRHVVSHTGKKMFNCEYCQKLFSRKDNLNKHRRSHETKQPNIVYTITQVK